MKHIQQLLYITGLVALLASGFVSCGKVVKPTSLIVLDSVRHYYPLLQGQVVDMSFRVANIGDEPLVFTDIMPSCGCIATDASLNKVILPGKEEKLYFKFNTLKYTGYVKHSIRLFGNIKPSGMAVITFDLVVVPPYDYGPDYEEHYWHEDDKKDWAGPGGRYKGQYWVPSEMDNAYTRTYFHLLDDKK